MIQPFIRHWHTTTQLETSSGSNKFIYHSNFKDKSSKEESFRRPSLKFWSPVPEIFLHHAKFTQIFVNPGSFSRAFLKWFSPISVIWPELFNWHLSLTKLNWFTWKNSKRSLVKRSVSEVFVSNYQSASVIFWYLK